MENLVTRLTRMYDESLDGAHPGMRAYPTMSSPLVCASLTIAYFAIVASSRRIMANRKAVEIRNLILAYNIVMVLLNGFMCYEFVMNGLLAGFHLGCLAVDLSDSPQSLRIVRVIWLFYVTKNIELLDTMFFIVRKKFGHVSFLHVIHHGVLPLTYWYGSLVTPGGFVVFHLTLNAFIHFAMYTYYALAALGPAAQRFLWWKRYMTTLQIVQFVAVVIHTSRLLLTSCQSAQIIQYQILTYNLVFLVLFLNFYIQSYIKQRNTAKATVSDICGTHAREVDSHKVD